MEHCSELAFKGVIARAFRTMQSQLQQAIRASKCQSFDEEHAYCKAYGMQLHKQYGMQSLKQAKQFIDIKILKSKFNECLSIRSDQKTDLRHAISYQHPLDALANEQGQRLPFKEKSAMLVMEACNNKLMGKFFAKKVIMKPTWY